MCQMLEVLYLLAVATAASIVVSALLPPDPAWYVSVSAGVLSGVCVCFFGNQKHFS